MRCSGIKEYLQEKKKKVMQMMIVISCMTAAEKIF